MTVMLLSLAELGLKHFFLLLKLEKKNAVSSRGFESFTCNFFLSNCCSREREIVRNSIWISWCLKYIYIALVHNEKKASSFFISLLKSIIIIWDFSLRVRFYVCNQLNKFLNVCLWTTSMSCNPQHSCFR